jgi:hypothetical protein
MSQLDEQARAILKKNDRGGYTVPTARLYPYQWNWDSAFVALGFATFDRARAWRELEMLLEGQWPNGMIPHILFRRDDPDYFPGPSVWQANLGSIPSGGISQPPVLSSIVRTLVETGGERDAKHAEAMFERLAHWHRWWHTERKPAGCPVVATVHPWETGRDNCPDWMIGMDAMAVHPDLEPYTRMDTKHANPAQRPSKEQYDKFVTIIKFGRDVGWDQSALTNEGPFLMADPGIHFILLRADRDLRVLATKLGRDTAEIDNWIDAGIAGTAYFWNAEIDAFCARDVRSGAFSNGFSNASALCFYAGAGTETQRRETVAHIERIGAAAKFLLPSWDPEAPMFEAQRYWCGPIWTQMNYIAAKGLAEAGHFALADRLRLDLRAMIEQSGFYECFDPISGGGCIGTDFSWTAAMWLTWASPSREA